MTTRAALAEGTRLLRAREIAEPRRTAQTMLAFATARDLTHLVVHDDALLTADELARFRKALRRRAAGEPVQYITGQQEFFGLEFEVTPAVLIPRPETELIVEAGLELLTPHAPGVFCDAGTGSGCITIALLVNLPQWRGVALDISLDALTVARRNAARHNVAARTRFIASDLFEGLKDGEQFSLIVSNPPYIAADELPTLQREVRDYEPRRALTPGADGLAIVRRLLDGAPAHIISRGHLVFEIGYGQEREVRSMIDARVWRLVRVQADLQGIGRTVVLQSQSC